MSSRRCSSTALSMDGVCHVQSRSIWIAGRDICVERLRSENDGEKLDRGYPTTELWSPCREKACAVAAGRAALALLHIGVLPIRDRLHRERPDAGVKHTERQVIDRNVYPSR